MGVLEGLSPSPSPPVILPGNSIARASLSSGIPTVPGKVTLQKDAQNLIGISIGGGAQYCPCLYIVQVLSALEVGGGCWRGRATWLLGHDKGSFLRSVKLAPSHSLQRGFLEHSLSEGLPLFFCHFNLVFFPSQHLPPSVLSWICSLILYLATFPDSLHHEGRIPVCFFTAFSTSYKAWQILDLQ